MSFKRNLAIFGLAATCAFAADKYEAEDAVYGTGVSKLTSASASGGAYLKMEEGDIDFNVTVPSAGNYSITIHYAGSYGEKINNLLIDGVKVAEITFASGKAFTDIVSVANLKAGANKITIGKSWGWIDVDYISVEPFTVGEFTLCNAPVTANATESAKKLYNFLASNFQKNTISGIMTGNMDNYTKGDATQHEDVQAVYTRSGKYPALVGVDMMNATGGDSESNWFKEYNEKALDVAKSIWKKGGIPAITWHWRPGEETQFYVAGANTNYTDFDFTNAFMTGTTTWDTLSTEYKALVGDIDKVSQHFLALQEEGVAAIFRPLHESGGSWFWWSTHTGKQFAALYQLMYERMVFKNGVNNLIWDFNPQTAARTDWTPGESYYDVLSIDIYNDKGNHASNSSGFFDLMNKFSTNKVLALSENGPIPDVDNMAADNALWSWWMPWYQSWNGGYVDSTSNDVWKKNMESDKIITLDEMPGWDNYTMATVGSQTCAVSKAQAKYDGDKDKASGAAKDYKMAVTVKELTEDAGANIAYTKIGDLTGSTTISLDIENTGADGVWIGLAFVRDGSADKAWTWEMSNSTDCWLEGGQKKTCEFDITEYTDDDGVTHATDLDKIFSATVMISTPGYAGTVIFDNMVTDNGKIINNFNSEKQLFTASEETEAMIVKIELVDETGKGTGTPAAIKTVAKAMAGSKLSVMGNSILLNAAQSGMVSVDVFGMTGKRVATLYRGMLSAGTHVFDMSDLAKGQYIIRVKGAGFAATQPVRR
ncbi:MAG: beta-mannosidase [Fibrobacter sp.]|nr:beta-mannosidase [Fibrobacter sp.]